MKVVNPLETNTDDGWMYDFYPVNWLLGSAASRKPNAGEWNQFGCNERGGN